MPTVLDKLIVQIGPDFVNMDKLRRFETSIGRVQAGMHKLGNTMIALGTLGTTAFAGAITSFAKYEQSLAKIEGLVGVSREQLAEWQDDIAAIAIETGSAPEQLAEALYNITSAGYEGATAIDILRASAQASVVGLGEQETVAGLITDVLGVYGTEAISAAEAMDQLTAAVREGKLEPASLARVLGTVLPFAQEAGVEFGEIAGAMAAMSRQGISANRGATALRGILAKILKPTEQGKKALAEYGVTMADLKRRVDEDGLLSALRYLRTEFGENDEAIGKVFEDVEGLLGVLSLTGSKVNENAEIMDSVSGATGDFGDAYEIAADTLIHQFNVALATLKVSLVELGAELVPMTQKIIGFAQSVLNWYRELDPAAKKMIALFVGLGPAVLAAGFAVKGLAFALGGLVPAIATLGRVSLAVRGVGLALATVTRLNPALLLLTGVAAAIMLAWEPVQTFFKGLLSTSLTPITEAFQRLMDALGPTGDALLDLFGRLGDAWSWLINLFSDADGSGVGAAFGNALIGSIESVINWITDLINLWNKMTALITSPSALIETLADGVSSVKDKLSGAVSGALEGVKNLLPFSDAREGPLSNLTRSGQAIIDTIAQGMGLANPLSTAFESELLRNPLLSGANFEFPVAPAQLPAGVQGAGGNTNSVRFELNLSQGAIQIDAKGSDARQIASEITERLDESMRGLAEQMDSRVLV